MKITQVETIWLEEFSNVIWIRVYTDEGIIGLGETFYGSAAVEAYIHESVAPYLIEKDPLQIDLHAKSLYGYLGYRSTGVEMRGNSAVDIALWDILGKASNQPVYNLLGGRSRESVRTYNTCAGYEYVRAKPKQAIENWGLPTDENRGPYEDLDAFLNRADELALDLISQGITGMKIWPFDFAAEATGGLYISNNDLEKAMEPFRKIRSAVGMDMDIMVEFHSLWNLPTARKIARALEEFEPFWYEDPLKADNIDALANYAASTFVPTTVSETLATRWSFREVMEAQAAGIIMLDLSWCGGISEAKKIAGMAEAHQLPIAPHDCTGPVVLMASMHLSLNATNALIQESVRAFYTGWYTELVTDLPQFDNGYLSLSEKPGLGTELLPNLHKRADAHQRISTRETIE
jgi:galactonate dehydratase